LPFVDTLTGLVVVSFALEILSLLWGPAKDASIPNLVDHEHLTSANSLGLVAAFGTFPLASASFALLAVFAQWLHGFSVFSSLELEFVALWVDGLTFLVSALIIWRLPIPRTYDRKGERVDWTATFRDIADGVRFIRQNRVVRGVIIGIGVGLIGGAAMIPLGPVFSQEVLGGGSAEFGVLMTALGGGAALGGITPGALQRRRARASQRCEPPPAGGGAGGDRFGVRRHGKWSRAHSRRDDVEHRSRCSAHRHRRRVRRRLVRDRLHRAPGECERRAPRPNVCRALHRGPALPAHLA